MAEVHEENHCEKKDLFPTFWGLKSPPVIQKQFSPKKGIP